MEEDGGTLLTTVERRLLRVGIVANVCGALDLFAFTALLLPVNTGGLDQAKLTLLNGVGFAIYMPIALVVGHRWGTRNSERMRPWLEAGRAPTPAERDYALGMTARQARVAAALWLSAAVFFTILNAFAAPPFVPFVPVLMALGAITTVTIYYLRAERILRPIVARALSAGQPEHPAWPGVRGRVTLVWLGATGVPLFGIAATALTGLLSDVSRSKLGLAVLFLAVVGSFAGLLATMISARSLSEPLAGVRDALERVERGDLSAEVPVDDGSELGLVEAGFNRMAAGLRERERVRDMFGRHVGRDVARAAIDGDLQLGGETRDVGVLFVDLIGSTMLAGQLPPQRVVALLNDFFAVVVAVAEAHGGFVNKFEGDGALCVFGAPIARDDPAGSALAAARELRARLLDELPQVDAGIGVSAGEAVAGNVGAEERFEYTVIGDPVNEAARLCDLAKLRPERLMASDAAVRRADPREAARWELGDPTVLRGREAPTRIATVG
jgi:adenylate cyclase